MFLKTKLTELNKLKKLTKNVVAVSGIISSRVKLETTIKPKPKPLRVCNNVATPRSANVKRSVSITMRKVHQ